MHPIIFTEFHQTKRGLPWQLLVFLLASTVLQYFLGPLAVLLLLSPLFGTAVGVGTLSEEYGKGQLRFLYSLPISPRALWCVKVLSGIIGTLLFVGVVLLPCLLISRPALTLPG